ncbi:transposase [Bradyrhizobium niftali]|uniref:IS66 family insertion sequence element accessory protein TnpB n=1 Tax=Bradyrhizobium niftali TaxID=2560055 RepID=UPI0038370EEF
MIPIAAGARIWIATGHTDMRKGMQGLALLVQEGLGRDPFAGDVFVFRGRAGTLIKAVWHDGVVLSLSSGWTVADLSGRRRWTAWYR